MLRFPMQGKEYCEDTSGRFFLKNDSLHFYCYTPAKTADGNLLVSGQAAGLGNVTKASAFLLKTDYDGNISWLKLYDSSGNQTSDFTNYTHVAELPDGNIFLAGATNNNTSGNSDILLSKADPNGNLIWSRTYKSRIWENGSGSNSYFYIQDLKPDPFTGEIYICGPHWSAGSTIIKINPADGSIMWSNLYENINSSVSFDRPFGMVIRQNDLLYFAGFLNSSATSIRIIRINKQTGDTLQTKFHSYAGMPRVGFLTPNQAIVLENGNYRISGRTFTTHPVEWNGVSPIYHAAIADFDENLNFVGAYAFLNYAPTNGYNTAVSIFPDGSGFLSMLNITGGFSGIHRTVQFKDGYILKQRQRVFTNEGMPNENYTTRLPDGGDLSVTLLGDSAAGGSRLGFLKLHITDTSSACLGEDDITNSIYPFTYYSDAWKLDSIGYNVLQETSGKTFRTTDISAYKLPGCQTTSVCDSLKLTSTISTICVGQSVAITVHKNKNCGSLVPLVFDTTAVASALQVNDSTINITFNKAWSGYIYASINSCNQLKDSIKVNVLQAPANLDLGSDTVICPNNTIVFNAGAGYASYLWQDGSTDSVLNVTTPGLYAITTETACGQTFKDTVIVAAHPPIPLDLGPDRTKCNKDTLQLQAPANFLTYNWSPLYQINGATSEPILIVSPDIDTAYILAAEKKPGCFAFDTVRIKVNHSPTIDLGPDRNLCKGNTLVLNAGPGFLYYAWNTGETIPQTTVSADGMYFISATTMEGCTSRDTVILNLLELPSVLLDQNPGICKNESRRLDAGTGYISYLWNTGDITRFLEVETPGYYEVKVTDQNGCTGTGSTTITTLYSLPQAFLPNDTSICQYGTLVLASKQPFETYLWSNGSTGNSITLSSAGEYWLKATDRNNCTGTDTLIVIAKECMKGLYVPSAFTPNADGKNDLLRPYLFGNIKSYHFRIANRWGQTVFETKDVTKGWDGKYKGFFQDSNVFVWICVYQLEGEATQTTKGFITLIR